MAIYFAVAFFQQFRERPPALRAVSAPVLDTKMEIPGTVINIKPSHKNQGYFKQCCIIFTEPQK